MKKLTSAAYLVLLLIAGIPVSPMTLISSRQLPAVYHQTFSSSSIIREP